VDFVSDVNVSAGGPPSGTSCGCSRRSALARARQRAGRLLDARARQDRHHPGLINANYQVSQNNRLTGLYSRHYRSPSVFIASNLATQDSTVNEDDVFDIYQLLLNSVVTQKFFIDARRVEPFLPTYQNTSEQTCSTRHQHPHPHFNVNTELARSLRATHRPVLRGQLPAPPRVQVRLRRVAFAGREPCLARR
jgi:hypothetical protein